MKNKINKLNKFKFTSESLERYKTDLAEYSFMLEQEYKKKLYLNNKKIRNYDIIIQSVKIDNKIIFRGD